VDVVVEAVAAEAVVEAAVEADSDVGEVELADAVVVDDPLLSAPTAVGPLSHPHATPKTNSPNVTNRVVVMTRSSLVFVPVVLGYSAGSLRVDC
jgi:hypothetical protein